MKKILLFGMASVAFIAANAQMIKKEHSAIKIAQANEVAKKTTIAPITKNTNNKKTRGQSGWMSYQDATFTSGTSTATLFPIYSDSSLKIVGTTSTFNWWIHGLGTSFDATSDIFTDAGFPFDVKFSDAYSIDSVNILGLYERRAYNNYVDTLIIEIASEGTGGSTVLQLKDAWFETNLGLADSTMRFGTAAYTNTQNAMSSTVTNKVVIKKILDAAAYADTTANGLHNFSIKLPTSLAVSAGSTVTALATFKSGFQYPFNTNLDSANIWSHYVIESNGTQTFPTPNTGDITSGLILTSDDRYRLTHIDATSGSVVKDYVEVSGVQYIQPTYWYSGAATYEDPYFSFHVVCPTCNPVATSIVSSSISIDVTPNPATSNVTFALNLKESAKNVTIEISNALGQVVKTSKVGSIAANTTSNTTISVSDLSAGMYIYTINADGQKTSNKLMVK